MTSGAARHVLVVDDDDDLRATLRDLLEEAGHVVVEAADGAPALRRLATSARGLVVLLDLQMPGTDGLAVLRAVAARERLAHHHAFVLLTALHDALAPPAEALLATLGGALMAKPFDLADLERAVEDAGRLLDAWAAGDTGRVAPDAATVRRYVRPRWR